MKSIVGRFHLFLLVVLLVVTGAAYVKIPDATGLPVHWALDGKPDEIWPKDRALLVLPILGIVFIAVFYLIGRFAKVEQLDPGRRVLELILTGILGLFCAIQFSFILMGLGADLDLLQIVLFLVALALVVIGFMLTQAERHSISPVRLPWTHQSPAAWRASHVVMGVLLALGGVGLGLAAYFQPNPRDMLAALAAALVVPVAVGGLFSLVRGRF